MKATLDAMQAWLKDETTSELFLQDLRALANFIYGWWDTRNKREGAFCYPWNRHLSACQPVGARSCVFSSKGPWQQNRKHSIHDASCFISIFRAISTRIAILISGRLAVLASTKERFPGPVNCSCAAPACTLQAFHSLAVVLIAAQRRELDRRQREQITQFKT